MTVARPLSATLVACAFAVFAAGCGQSSPPPPANSAAPPPVSAAPAPAPAPEPARADEGAAPAQSGASVAELMGDSGNPPPAAEAAPASGVDPGPATSDEQGVAYAQVVSVQKIEGPRQVCTERTVVEKRRPEDEHRVAGKVIGAIAGGLIGSKLGRGRGRTAATVGGAVAGGAIGNEVQRQHQERDTVTRVVKHCRAARAEDGEGKVLYDVVYAYQGENFHVKLDYDPGDRIALPVRAVE